jgi:hypothetical protein
MSAIKNKSTPGILVIVAALIFLAASVHCSKCSKSDEPKGRVWEQQSKRPLKPVIAGVRLEPRQPTAAHFITAQPSLEDPGMSHVKFTYQWFIDGKNVPGNDQNTLAGGLHKKGDRVYCQVTASRGIYTSRPVKSKAVTVQNARPRINLQPVDRFETPGRFYYTITASDPDGDPLSYRLIAPLDVGIIVDRETGEITWDIAELPNEKTMPRQEDERAPTRGKIIPPSKSPKLSSIVTIIFEVTDPEGAAAKGSLELNLAKGNEIPQ